MRRLLTLFFGLWLLGGAACAQEFSIALQFSTATPTPFSVFNGRSQMEVNYRPLTGISVGGRFNLESTPLLSQFAMRVQGFGLYHLAIYGDGLWSVNGYAGLQAGGYYTPGLSSSSTSSSSSGSSGTDDDHGGSGSSSTEAETEDEGSHRPGGNYQPTQVLEFSLMTLSGVDAAYFIDEQFSAYMGFEVDVLLYPTQTPTLYPYAEVDYQALDNLSLALGGYTSLNLGAIGYNLYLDVFYALEFGLRLQFELGFNGGWYSFLRFAYHF